ncbi:MAG: hypothetical protein DLM71_02335 [Chloroflexi bacterium]|nr:MAG: hypothetical protein DLM71_02335 [Chloroflexota bacterium]
MTRWWILPLAVGVLSRVYSIGLIALLPSATPVLKRFVTWDGGWYLGVAQLGYHARPIGYGTNGPQHDFAFFPGWPMTIRLGSFGFIPMPVVAAVLANILFVVAIVVLYRVFAARYHGAALLGVTLLAFSPAAYVFSMAYSESLFLLLVALLFACRAPLGRPILAAAATFTRSAGLALLAPAAVELWRGRPRRAVGLGLGVAAGLGAWSLFVWQLTGDPLSWLHESVGWSPDRGFAAVALVIRHPDAVKITRLAFAVLILCAAALSALRDLELGSYSFAEVAMTMLAGTVYSAPRFALLGISAFPELAARLRGRRALVLLVIFALAQAFFVLTVFGSAQKEP